MQYIKRVTSTIQSSETLAKRIVFEWSIKKYKRCFGSGDASRSLAILHAIGQKRMPMFNSKYHFRNVGKRHGTPRLCPIMKFNNIRRWF